MSSFVSRRLAMSPIRLVVLLVAPASVALASAVYLTVMMDDMSVMPGMSSMAAPFAFAPSRLWGLFVMWTVMMAAMMLPSAAPMIASYARMRGADRDRTAAALAVLCFAGGYVAAWSAFSAGATALQAGLTQLALLSPMGMKIAPGPLAGGILVAAGLYQWLPLKQSCLRHCRTPIGYLMTAWRDGKGGALVMGWRHGLFCIGCCVALMVLLFVAGVMNPIWIVALAAYVLIEKIAPHGEIVARAAGVVLIAAGIWMMMA